MKRKQQGFMLKRGTKEQRRDSRGKISISLLYSLGFLLLLLWSVGCSPNLNPQDTISNAGTEADFNGVLAVVDISDPAKPVKVSSTFLPSKLHYYSSLTVWKQFVLATTAYGVHLLDMEKPAAPRLLWNLPLPMLSGKPVIFKNYAFFPTQNGLNVLHLKNPLEPQWVFPTGGKGNLRSHLIDLKIKGDYAYTYDVHKYLHVLNLSQPEQPKLVNSYAIQSPPSVLLLRALGEEARPIKINVDSLTDRIRAFHLERLYLLSALSNHLADRTNLIELSANWRVRVVTTPQYICWVYRYDDYSQLWFLPWQENHIYSLDVIPAYTKYLYSSGRHPGGEDITDVIRGEWEDENTLYLIFETDWKTTKINQSEGGRVTDFQLSTDLAYILREHGVLFIAKLSTTDRLELKGMALLENLPQSSQTLTLDKNFLYVLGEKSQPEVQSK